VDDFFAIILEYLARTLAAYLNHVWLPGATPDEKQSPTIKLQLLGNGWRLNYSGLNYRDIIEHINKLLCARFQKLWQELNPNETVAHSAFQPSYNHAHDSEPKSFSVKNAALLRLHDTAELVKDCALGINAFVRDQDTILNWHTLLPASAVAKSIYIRDVTPNITLHSKVSLLSLSESEVGNINKALRDELLHQESAQNLSGPASAIIWERLLEKIKGR
jgi:hypothetical protein